jgi:hypothetical protein
MRVRKTILKNALAADAILAVGTTPDVSSAFAQEGPQLKKRHLHRDDQAPRRPERRNVERRESNVPGENKCRTWYKSWTGASGSMNGPGKCPDHN